MWITGNNIIFTSDPTKNNPVENNMNHQQVSRYNSINQEENPSFDIKFRMTAGAENREAAFFSGNQGQIIHRIHRINRMLITRMWIKPADRIGKTYYMVWNTERFRTK